MTTPQALIHNVITGEIIIRDFTEIELAQLEKDKARNIKDLADTAKAEEARDRKRQEVLDRLGITAEELKTILS